MLTRTQIGPGHRVSESNVMCFTRIIKYQVQEIWTRHTFRRGDSEIWVRLIVGNIRPVTRAAENEIVTQMEGVGDDENPISQIKDNSCIASNHSLLDDFDLGDLG